MEYPDYKPQSNNIDPHPIGDYIQTYDDMLSKDLCADIIKIFNNEQYPVVRHEDDLNPRFTQMHMTNVIGKDHSLHQQCLSVFKNVLHQYRSDVFNGHWIPRLEKMEEFRIKHYATETDDQFDSHVDCQCERSQNRCLALFFYLNDVEAGGETDFHRLKTVSPQRGRVVVFPPTFQFPHAGLPVKGKNDKFLLSSYLHYPSEEK